MVAALGNFQVRIVPRGQLDALGRNQIGERVVLLFLGHELVNSPNHLFVGMGTGNRQNTGVGLADPVGFDSHAAGDDDFPVFTDGLTNRIQGFLLGSINKATGIHHHDIGVVIGGDHVIPIEPELGEDALRIHEGLGAAQADEADLAMSGFRSGVLGVVCHKKLGVPGAQKKPTNE